MSETTWLPGMACRDPETGDVYRCIDPTARVGWVYLHGWAAHHDSGLTRALAAGPDLTDLATAAVYAAQRGWDVNWNDNGKEAEVWTGPAMTPSRFRCPTLPEAVQAAAKAQEDR